MPYHTFCFHNNANTNSLFKIVLFIPNSLITILQYFTELIGLFSYFYVYSIFLVFLFNSNFSSKKYVYIKCSLFWHRLRKWDKINEGKYETKNNNDDRLKFRSTRPSMSFKVPIAKSLVFLSFIFLLLFFPLCISLQISNLSYQHTTHAITFMFFLFVSFLHTCNITIQRYAYHLEWSHHSFLYGFFSFLFLVSCDCII